MSVENGFELLREEQIAELNTLARLYRHVETGAQLLSLINKDENKAFGITFRTPPDDSTGLPHILEHVVLGGSRKYPVKEPFVELMKGSLNTFLNAMTYPDKTCYPVASQNLQDFYNLIDVYLDGVFFPRLTPYALMQEGWHYEAEDPTAPLEFKGVVFNEMKGAYSDPQSVLSDQIQQSLLPDTIYRHDSGGNPTNIPDLTFEQFQSFHQRYYHPSNALIFFYGDDDPEMRLVLLQEYLCMFERIPAVPPIDLQHAFTEPRRVEASYEISEGQQDAKTYVTVNWLLPEGGDPETTLALSVMEQVLIGTPAAQLRKTLIDSGLGEDLTGLGFETSYQQMIFSTGLKGVAPENVPAAEQLVLDTVTEVTQNGVDPENIAAALNTIEFSLRENNTGRFPRGLALMLRSLESWVYGKDPIAPLAFEAPLQAVKARIAGNPSYLTGLVKNHLVDNPHRTTVVLTPNERLAEERAAKERARLDSDRAAMDEERIRTILQDAATLKERQETPDTPEMLMTIPMLELEDLDKEIRRIPSQQIQTGAANILYHDLFTNGILYLDLGFSMRVLPQEWLPYISLFGRALTETGTDKENFVQLLQRIGRSTGGVRATTLTSASRANNETAAWLFLRGKAMVAQTGDLLTILRDVLTSANFQDRERFKQMALEEKARLESRLVGAGHALINSRLAAHFSEAGWVNETMGGISYLFFLRELTRQIDSNWDSVAAVLEGIRATLLTGSNALCNITLDSTNWQAIQPTVQKFLSGLREGHAAPQQWNRPKFSEAEGLTIPAQVNFVGKGANLYNLGYQLHGSAFVINNHLNGSWLWDKIRVQGGAYGGFATFDQQSGVFNFLSYRDPNVLQSLNTYDATAGYLTGLSIDNAEVTKAIIGTIGDMDSYLLPDAKGFTALRFHLLGITDEERQRLRDQVLGTTADDFRRFGETLSLVKEHGEIAALGEENGLREAGVFDEVTKVL